MNWHRKIKKKINIKVMKTKNIKNTKKLKQNVEISKTKICCRNRKKINL